MSNINHIKNRSRTSLHFACEIQNLELVQSLLKNGENPNAVDDRMNTPLHLACISKSNVTVTIIELLLQHNANPNAVDDQMNTPLYLACISESNVTVTIIELLLQHNANIEAAENECGWTPLHIACRRNNYVAVQCLLKNRAKFNATDRLGCTPLFNTVHSNGSISIAQLLLQYNNNIEAADWNGRTPFLEACYNCNYVVAKFLLDNHANPFAVDNKGSTSLHLVCHTKNNMTVTLIEILLHYVNIEAVNASGWTPLIIACDNNNLNAIKCLLDHHANIEVVDASGQTPLIVACRKCNYDTIKYFLDHNANIEALDANSRTPLITACDNKNLDAIKCLLDHHANIEASDASGQTPLIVACRKCNYDTIKYILDHNANIEALDASSRTPLITACDNNNLDAIKCLLDHHANIEALDACSRTPLIIACDNNNLNAIKCLLDHHANIEAVDARGRTPLMIACKNDNYDLIKYLLDHHANIEAVDSTVSTSFIAACNNDNHNAIKPLLDFEKYRKFKILHHYAYNCSKTPLHFACKSQNLELVQSLLKNGENPNAVDDRMNTPLHLACISKSNVTVTIIELLLQHNANIEAAENECGWTPLITACIHNNDVAVKCLLENHADSNAMDRMGHTSLHLIFCCHSDYIALRIAQLLLQYHANVEARSYNGRTPFLMACWNCNYVAAKFFLDNHVNPFAADNDGCTSLHFVCDRKNDVTVRLLDLLLQNYANIEAVDKKGWTPFMVASNRGNCNAIQYLFNHSANVNHSDINNSTALHIAIEQQSVKTTECLIECNADINLLDKENQTPLEKALKMESSGSYPLEIVTTLMSEVVKLKVAGFKIHHHNLDILHNRNPRPHFWYYESCLTKEIEQMKRKNIDNNEMTLYDFIKNNIRFLCQFVTDKKFQQQLGQQYLNEQFRSYTNIARNRFREATIQCTRNKLINQAKEYFRLYINQQLPYEILDCIFIPLSISELKFFVKSYQEAIKYPSNQTNVRLTSDVDILPYVGHLRMFLPFF